MGRRTLQPEPCDHETGFGETATGLKRFGGAQLSGFGPGLGETGRLLGELGPGESRRRLIGSRVDAEKEVAGPDAGTLTEVDGLKDAGDAGADLDLAHALHLARSQHARGHRGLLDREAGDLGGEGAGGAGTGPQPTSVRPARAREAKAALTLHAWPKGAGAGLQAAAPKAG